MSGSGLARRARSGLLLILLIAGTGAVFAGTMWFLARGPGRSLDFAEKTRVQRARLRGAFDTVRLPEELRLVDRNEHGSAHPFDSEEVGETRVYEVDPAEDFRPRGLVAVLRDQDFETEKPEGCAFSARRADLELAVRYYEEQEPPVGDDPRCPDASWAGVFVHILGGLPEGA